MIDKEMQEKIIEGKRSAMRLRKQLNIPSPLKAIRDMCKDCVGSAAEVKICGVEKCPVWAFRFGRSPKETDLKVPEFDSFGNVIDHHDFTGYRY
jgi:hypothetical protein